MYGTNLFGIGLPELFFIGIIALIVLGPTRLPGVIREVGKVIRQIRSITSELTSQFSEELALLDEINPQKIIQELVDDPKEKEAAQKSTTEPAAKKTPAKKVTKPAAGSKPALGGITPADKASSTESDAPLLDADAQDVADTTTDKDGGDKSTEDKTVDQTIKATAPQESSQKESSADLSNDVVPDVIEEAEAVAARVDMSEIENRIAPPSMDGAAQAMRGKSVAKATPKSVEKTTAVKESAQSTVEERIADPSLDDSVVGDASMDDAPPDEAKAELNTEEADS